MFGQNREQLRQFYHDIWQKMQQNTAMSALENQVAQVIAEHPEYHTIFNQDQIDKDFSVEEGQTNPYLHMGLHISLHEQIGTNRPAGIRDLYQQLQTQYASAHEAEHQMMECLTESLWLAQRNNQPPSEAAYLEALRRLIHTKTR